MKVPGGRLAGYESWDGTDPFEDHAGPYFFKRHENGTITCAFEATPTHCNGGGFLHGGSMMTFADYSLFAIAKDVLQGHGVTISFSSEFIAAGQAGDFVESRGKVVKATGSMIFMQGEVFTGSGENEKILLNFSGIIKRVREKA
ncbi:MAG: PaaI family thioesterase [Rhizobiales bacterium]|nr:PaaI family thioesterase [Hyphomicrobiales bacterium]